MTRSTEPRQGAAAVAARPAELRWLAPAPARHNSAGTAVSSVSLGVSPVSREAAAALLSNSLTLLTKTPGLFAGKSPSHAHRDIRRPAMMTELDFHDSATSRNPAGGALDAILSAAAACRNRLLAALHESRRKQAAIELSKHRPLMFDSETGVYFRIGIHPE
jgi:hypothetical protein